MSETCFTCETPIVDGVCLCNAPWACPGCQAMVGEPCAQGCPDDEYRKNREDDDLRFSEKYDDDPSEEDEPDGDQDE